MHESSVSMPFLSMQSLVSLHYAVTLYAFLSAYEVSFYAVSGTYSVSFYAVFSVYVFLFLQSLVFTQFLSM